MPTNSSIPFQPVSGQLELIPSSPDLDALDTYLVVVNARRPFTVREMVYDLCASILAAIDDGDISDARDCAQLLVEDLDELLPSGPQHC